jgi:long-chain fatty acid transport protein
MAVPDRAEAHRGQKSVEQMNPLPRSWRQILKIARTVPSLFFLILSPHSARAVGFRLPNQDPEGIARGNAFVATADNPSAVYYNPAGITQLEGDQVHAGLYLISADTEYSSSFGKANTDTTLQAVPQLYYTHGIQAYPVTLGLGVYAPYGLGLDYGDNPPFGPIAQRGELLYAAVNPVVAWRAHRTLSIAIGPTINYSDVDLENFSFKFRGNDVAFGFSAGVFWHPIEKLAFGASYHSATELDYSGHSYVPAFSLGRNATSAEAHFPQFIAVGVSFRPTKNWNFECDVDWTDWDSLNQIEFERDDSVTIPYLFNYQSSYMYEFGVTRQMEQGWFMSAGYIFSETSSPDKDFNPIVPDLNLHLGSIGFGRRGKHWDWAVGYHFAYGNRDVTRAANPLSNGHYDTLNNAVNIAATYKF